MDEQTYTDNMLKEAQRLAEEIQFVESVDTEFAYNRTISQIHSRQRSKWLRVVTRAAAVLAIPLLFATVYLSYMQVNQPEKVAQQVDVKAALGTIIRYELPDKSVAWLYSGSSISYPATFDKEHRDVTLTGMAYFEVQSDKEHPFFVHTKSGAQVYVYGTKFNMVSYDDDPFVEAVLEEGQINLVTPDMKQYKVNPGEVIDYYKESRNVTKEKANVREKTAWLEGKLIFRDTKMDEVFIRLARHFNVDIEVHNPHNRAFKYHATFSEETLHQILTYLSASAKMQWQVIRGAKKEDGTFTKEKVIVDIE